MSCLIRNITPTASPAKPPMRTYFSKQNLNTFHSVYVFVCVNTWKRLANMI